MLHHDLIDDDALCHLIRRRAIVLAGNWQMKIYGTLKCRSGKRMKRSNRVFFADVAEAGRHGFRPCGHCMHQLYKEWKFRALPVAEKEDQATGPGNFP
jgi:nitrate reductase beta subunit